MGLADKDEIRCDEERHLGRVKIEKEKVTIIMLDQSDVSSAFKEELIGAILGYAASTVHSYRAHVVKAEAKGIVTPIAAIGSLMPQTGEMEVTTRCCICDNGTIKWDSAITYRDQTKEGALHITEISRWKGPKILYDMAAKMGKKAVTECRKKNNLPIFKNN